jgi:inhibitor of KinA sporulation pathway (predicted exonuclease)
MNQSLPLAPRIPDPELMRQLQALAARRYLAVIDLEATCYGNPQEDAEQAKEIIEVGWALLHVPSRQVVASRQFYVRPTTSHVSQFCTTLTGIEAATVAQAPAFREVLQDLGQLHAQVPEIGEPVTAWASFGAYDRRQFERQCAAEDVANPMALLEHTDIKPIVGMCLGAGKKKSPGLARAMTRAGMEMQGRHHSGVDDARNTARLLAWALGPA